MAERHYQPKVIKRLRREFDGCYILKNDANYLQGVPDLILLYGPYWAMLEVKKAKPKESDFEPNQEYYVSELNQMSFAAVIYPENEDEVFRALQLAFQPRRPARVSKR